MQELIREHAEIGGLLKEAEAASMMKKPPLLTALAYKQYNANGRLLAEVIKLHREVEALKDAKQE